MTAKEAPYEKWSAEDLCDVLRRHGFVPCDNPVCNCNSWHHRYGLAERWVEIKEALEEAGHPLTNENGHVVLNAIKELITERDALRMQEQPLDAERVQAKLRELSEWFDDPTASPAVALSGRSAGYLLRSIAGRLAYVIAEHGSRTQNAYHHPECE